MNRSDRGWGATRIIAAGLVVFFLLPLMTSATLLAAPVPVQSGPLPFEFLAKPDEHYKLAKYDVLNIIVDGVGRVDLIPQGNSASNMVPATPPKGTIIGPDGYMSLPYIGSVKLAGLTIPEATTLLTERLGQYFKEPTVSVLVESFGPRKISVMGEVKNSGVYPLGSDSMNILAALSSAGGITKKGRPKHIAVIRMVDGKIYMKEVNFDLFVKKQDASQNVLLQDGDMVYVPESNKIDFFSEIMPLVNSYMLFRNATK